MVSVTRFFVMRLAYEYRPCASSVAQCLGHTAHAGCELGSVEFSTCLTRTRAKTRTAASIASASRRSNEYTRRFITLDVSRSSTGQDIIN